MNRYVWLIVILVLGGCSSRPGVIDYPKTYSGKGSNEIYVVSHGWHTGFVVPSEQFRDRLPEVWQRFEHAPYVEFGWGDKGFYQAPKITTGLAVRAIFWPTDTVIHSVAVPYRADKYFPNSEVALLCLNDEELTSLVTFISNSFYQTAESKVEPQKNGLYGDSQFYTAVGNYYLMNTCNKWTAKGLQSFGMDLSPTFKLTAGSVMNAIKVHSKRYSYPGERDLSVPVSCGVSQ